MLNIKKIVLTGMIAAFMVISFSITGAQASLIEAPAITEVVNIESKALKPIIKGETNSDTLVNIYIDGVYNGKTVILSGDEEKIGFDYEAFLFIKSGEHAVWAIAEDEQGNKSAPSDIFFFIVQEDIPAPILYSPTINNNTTFDQPLITGMARNDLKINIYIDNELNGEIEAAENDFDTAVFTFKPEKALSRGQHMLYAVAQDNKGRKSDWSNIIYFKISTPIIIDSAEEENRGDVDTATEAENSFQKSENLLSAIEAEEAQTGKDAEKKMPLNLIVFIIFLAGLAGWIVWVNKELIKEKTEQSKSDFTDPASQKTPKQ